MKCRIIYYEYCGRLWVYNQAEMAYVLIDGFFGAPSEGKLCLGSIKNPKRSFEADKIRKQIGTGLRIFTYDNGVWLQNFSVNNVYVHAPFYNKCHELEDRHISRLEPSRLMLIFDHHIFETKLLQAKDASFEEVYNLTSMCTACISFIKGFGDKYSRQNANQCPCWVEFTLEEPISKVDVELQKLGAPTNRCSSTT